MLHASLSFLLRFYHVHRFNIHYKFLPSSLIWNLLQIVEKSACFTNAGIHICFPNKNYMAQRYISKIKHLFAFGNTSFQMPLQSFVQIPWLVRLSWAYAPLTSKLEARFHIRQAVNTKNLSYSWYWSLSNI